MRLNRKNLKTIALSAAMVFACCAPVQATNDNTYKEKVESVVQINPTTVELRLSDNRRVTLDFYGDNIFRMFQDNNGGIVRDPEPMAGYPEAQILVDNPRKAVENLNIKESDKTYTVTTAKIELSVCKATGQIRVKNLTTGQIAFEEVAPVQPPQKQSVLS